jgi:hypothetical protein
MTIRIITPQATLSYPALFAPKEALDGKLKYSCCLIFTRNADLKPLKDAARAVAVGRWGLKVMLKESQLKWPFRDGAERSAAGFGPNTTFINVTSERQPGVVSRFAGADGKPTVITDPDELYPGCVVRASLGAFSYDRNGNRGVSFGLNALQKLGEGKRLDGRVAVEDEFDALEDDLAEPGSGSLDDDPDEDPMAD